MERNWQGGINISDDPVAAVMDEYSSIASGSDREEFPSGGPLPNIDILIGKCCSIDAIEPESRIVCYKLIDTKTIGVLIFGNQSIVI